MKNKLLFIDYSFHNKTSSSKFMYELLSEKYEVTKIDYSFDLKVEQGEMGDDTYDVIIFWQIMPDERIVNSFNSSHIVFFPMYDAVADLPISGWEHLRNVLIISFSLGLYRMLNEAGYDVHYIQFFPEPVEINNMGALDTVFFWQRTYDININYINKLLNDDIKKVHIHKATDPGRLFIRPIEENRVYTYSKWFENKSDLVDVIQKAALYVAPRIKEGIGMSFLDAMAMGRCVIAPNYGTMNEYIQDGVTGILYEYGDTTPLSGYDVREIQKNAYDYIKQGYEQWSKQKYEIFEWIETFARKPLGNKGAEIITDVKMKPTSSGKSAGLYRVSNKWLILAMQGITLAKYMEDKKINSVVIYGYNELSRRLEECLLNANVEIKAVIDRRGGVTRSGDVILKDVQAVGKADIIVVTAVASGDEIIRSIKDRVHSEIIKLEDMIDDAISMYV